MIKPWVNGQDLMGRSRDMWIIDFGIDMTLDQAALYEAPFEYALRTVRPMRETSLTTESRWWIHERPGHSMRVALGALTRYIATPETAKHRVFAWLPVEVLADQAWGDPPDPEGTA